MRIFGDPIFACFFLSFSLQFLGHNGAKMGTGFGINWSPKLVFSSLFPRLVLALVFDTQPHEKVTFWEGPNP